MCLDLLSTSRQPQRVSSGRYYHRRTYLQLVAVQYSSGQDGVYTLSGKLVIMRSIPSVRNSVSPEFPFRQFQCCSDWWWPFLVLSRKIVERFLCLLLSPTPSSPLLPPPQEIDIVMSLGLSPRPVSRASQQFRSYDVHAICEGCGFTRQLHHGFPYRRKTNTCLSLFEAVMSGRQASNRRVEDVDLNELCWHLSSRNNQSSQPRLP